MSKHHHEKKKGNNIVLQLGLNETGKKSWNLIENKHSDIETYFASNAHPEDLPKVGSIMNSFRQCGNSTADYNGLMLLIDPIINPRADSDIAVGY